MKKAPHMSGWHLRMKLLVILCLNLLMILSLNLLILDLLILCLNLLILCLDLFITMQRPLQLKHCHPSLEMSTSDPLH
jgi:hypothetical protein